MNSTTRCCLLDLVLAALVVGHAQGVRLCRIHELVEDEKVAEGAPNFAATAVAVLGREPLVRMLAGLLL